MSDMPDWWTKAETVWEEDDGLTHDRETINAAWARIFKRTKSNEVKKFIFDGGDAIFTLYESGRVACDSYPGNNEIRVYHDGLKEERPAPKISCNCVGCGRRHEIWNGQTVPPGWRAFPAAHWPAGNPEAQALGPLYLRLCGACVEKMDRGPSLVDLNVAVVTTKTPEELLKEMSDGGWATGVHNDYRQGGQNHTFWLFTHPSGRYVKGEGKSYQKALADAVAAKRRLEDAGLL